MSTYLVVIVLTFELFSSEIRLTANSLAECMAMEQSVGAVYKAHMSLDIPKRPFMMQTFCERNPDESIV